MYLMSSGKYQCDFCDYETDWDKADEEHGVMWECECCGKHFCTKCFERTQGTESFAKMMKESNKVLCPDCYKESEEKKMKNFKRMIRRTWKNKAAALALAVLAVAPVIMFPQEDAAGSLLVLLFAIPLFFEKQSVVK